MLKMLESNKYRNKFKYTNFKYNNKYSFGLVRILVWIILYRSGLDSEESVIESREFPVVYVPLKVEGYHQVFNQPWNLLQLTRKCDVPCSFLSMDIRYNRYFIQNNKEHEWIDNESTLKYLKSNAKLTLVNENSKRKVTNLSANMNTSVSFV